jgi:apolipoprotein D and lipocalin family protein
MPIEALPSRTMRAKTHRRMGRAAGAAWGGIAVALLAGCASIAPAPELPVVDRVDLSRYMGRWYEIAAIPHWFQRGCTASTAEYSLRNDGRVDVLNRCHLGAPEGPVKQQEGVAKVVDPRTNAKLAVTFFWPFAGDYWIIALDRDYRYAMVGHPSRDFLWILSRTPTMPEETVRALLAQAATQGYDVGRVQRTDQGGRS